VTNVDAPHRHLERADELVPLDAYRRELLSRIAPLEPITVGLLEAHGCVLAEDAAAEHDVPPFANSAMDGYAVRSSDAYEGAELAVVGEVAAGAELPAGEVGFGQAVRIMTGAPLPPGADVIVPVEQADEDAEGARVRLRTTGRRGDHIRGPGEDVRGGEVVLQAGRRLGAADIGMLAAIGRVRVLVHPQPRVVIISTGDELLEPGTPDRPGAIRDANSFALTALARECGAAAFRLPVVGDDRRALQEAFEGALTQADLLVTSGGVSAGRYDYVKQVLAQLGDVRFTKVGMQPGMPQAFGFLDGVPCFGLPGNPVSAYVSFEVFVRPALRRMQGRTDLNRPRVTAILEDEVASPPGRVSFLRVKLHRDGGVWHARTTGAQGSGILRSLVEADGLAEIPSDRTSVFAGERVVVHLLVDTA
jgi:molybdopterin molybdotransferase